MVRALLEGAAVGGGLAFDAAVRGAEACVGGGGGFGFDFGGGVLARGGGDLAAGVDLGGGDCARGGGLVVLTGAALVGTFLWNAFPRLDGGAGGL